METQSPYTFNQVGNNVEVLQNGQRISTGTASAAERYGYVANPVGVAKTLNPDTTAPAVQSTTPTTLSGDKSQQIADNTRKVQDLTVSNQPTQQLTGGIEYYSDGTPISAPSDAIIQRDESGNTWWSAGGKNYAIGPDQGLSAEEKQKKDLLEQVKNQTDSAFARQISAVQAQYDSLIKQQKDVSLRQEASVGQSLLMGGTSRYAGLNAAGIDTAQISYGIQQIADLQAKQNMAIAQIQSAQADKNYEFVSKELQRLDDIKKEKQKVAKDLNDKLLEANKALRQQAETRNNAIDNDIRTAILDAQKGGATPEQLAAMRDALANHDYASAVAAGGDSLQNASGIVGEYNFYVRDAKARGQVPVSFNEYQTMDANRKARVAAAGAQIIQGTNMTTKQQSVFNQIVDKRNKSPLIAANDRAIILKDLTNAVEADPSNAALQVSFIYGMIQALDTYQSAVREGEINLVKDTQGLGEKLGNIVSKVEKGNPLNPSKVKEYVAVAKTLTNSINSAANKKNNVFKAQAISNGIGTQWDEFEKTSQELNQTSSGGDIIQSQEQAKNAVDSYISINPKDAETVAKLYEIPSVTDQDVYNYLKANGKIQ